MIENGVDKTITKKLRRLFWLRLMKIKSFKWMQINENIIYSSLILESKIRKNKIIRN